MAPRFWMLAVLLAWLSLGLAPVPVRARLQPAPTESPRFRPAAAPPGEPFPDPGAEPSEPVLICLLSPVAYPEAGGRVRARVPLARPTIFARGAFAELRLERAGQTLWRLQADAEQPLQGPLAWPLPPLGAGETLLLHLRPIGVAPEAFATVELIAADSPTLSASAQLRRQLGRDPERWLQTVLRELEASHTELALALLFDFEGPSSPALDALRREIHDRACASLILSPESAAP